MCTEAFLTFTFVLGKILCQHKLQLYNTHTLKINIHALITSHDALKALQAVISSGGLANDFLGGEKNIN